MTISKGKPGRPKGYSPKLGRFLTARELAAKNKGESIFSKKAVKIARKAISRGAKPSKVKRAKPVERYASNGESPISTLVKALRENTELLKEGNALIRESLNRTSGPQAPSNEAMPDTEAEDPWVGDLPQVPVNGSKELATNDELDSIMNP